MNAHALSVLEFDDALAIVAAYAASDLGAMAIRALRPSADVGGVREALATVAEGMRLLGSDAGWPMPDIPDLAEPLARLAVPGYGWDGSTLRAGWLLLSACRSARSAILPRRDDAVRLGHLAELLADLPAVIALIDRSVAEDGEVRDNASPELSRLRRAIQGARSKIVQRLSEYAASLPAHYQVSDASISIREGRYVVPVRREGRSEVGGIVHGESQTGATLFIEPPLAIELMNRLRELESEEAREVHRILTDLTNQLRPHAPEMRASLEALIVLDSFYARARYGLKADSYIPDVVAPGEGSLAIVQGRHPILLARGEVVVPFDLALDEGEKTLIISGPNTGGKTVLLKAVGLLSLLTQAGVAPPVGPGSRLVLFTAAYADIGDEQSIEASLSTFSAHLKNLRETLDHADGGSLVLIDEIGSGTDPVEGAALAQAILLELTRRGALTVATTHLGSLKLLATDDARIVNASLQFDAERMQPTYRLVKGVPGRSFGLAIARRLGMSPDVLAEAEAALPEGERDVGKLLLELEAREQRVTSLSAELQSELERNRALAAELEARERELLDREKDSERRSRQQARDLLLQSRAEVEAAIRDVRGAADEAALDEAARTARRRVEEAARRQRERIPVEPRRPARTSAPTDLQPGMRVRIASLARTGVLLEIRESKGVVDAGGMRLQLPIGELSALPPGDQAEPSLSQRRPAGGRFEVDFDASPEVDLRGLRVDELETRLARALDKALVAGLPSFRIIHGKGTGALRSRVQTILEGDPRIARFRPGERYEGGTGVTVVEFG